MLKNRIIEIDNLKKEIDYYRPLTTPILDRLRDYFRVGLTYSSNALEGNTLTETETKIILEDGFTIGGKTLKEHLEVVGHSNAYDFMLSKIDSDNFAEDDIRKLHYFFYYRIDQENAGIYRKVPVFVTGTDFAFPKPLEVPQRMKEFMQEVPLYKEKYHPVEYAALIHAKLVTIHPFVDGNGRTARLLMNLALLQSGYVLTIIPPIMRSTYISTIRHANKGATTPFLEFISEMVYESSKEYLRLIRSSV